MLVPVDVDPPPTIGFEISIDQASSPNTPFSTIIGSLLSSCSSQSFLICSDCLSISLIALATLTSIHCCFNHSMKPSARCCTNGFLNFFFTHLSALSYQGSTPSPKVFSKENSTDNKSFSESNALHLIVCKSKLILKFLCHFLIPFLYMVQRMYDRIHLSMISARHNLILKKLFRLNSTMKNCSWQCEWWDSNPHCRDFKSPVSAVGLHSQGDPGRTRTYNQLLRRQLLYSIELLSRIGLLRIELGSLRYKQRALTNMR